MSSRCDLDTYAVLGTPSPAAHYGNWWGKWAYKSAGTNRELTMIHNGISLSEHRNMYRLFPHLLP